MNDKANAGDPQPDTNVPEPRAHWVAPKLQQFRAGSAESGTSVGPDAPETGSS